MKVNNNMAVFQRPHNELEKQCLRVLRCTAWALAHSPGGLRFKAGTRPWLDMLSANTLRSAL